MSKHKGNRDNSKPTLPEDEILGQMARPSTGVHGQQSTDQQAQAAGEAFDSQYTASQERSQAKKKK